MRIITQNVRKWHGDKAERLCNHLISMQPDVIIFTEHLPSPRANTAKSMLYGAGYIHHYETQSASGKRGSVLVATKMPCELAYTFPSLQEPSRFLSLRLHTLLMTAVYMPNLYRKKPYWEALIDYTNQHRQTHHIIMGDFNTGDNHRDRSKNSTTFVLPEYYHRFAKEYASDVWRAFNRDAEEYSWYSNQGNGFRLDHAFASPSLQTRITSCVYDHTPRLQGYSDHSALIVDINPPT